MGFFEGSCLEEGVTAEEKSGIEKLTDWLKIGGNFLSFIFLSFHMVFLFFENIFIQNEIPGPTKWKLAAQFKKTSTSPLIH